MTTDAAKGESSVFLFLLIIIHPPLFPFIVARVLGPLFSLSPPAPARPLFYNCSGGKFKVNLVGGLGTGPHGVEADVMDSEYTLRHSNSRP